MVGMHKIVAKRVLQALMLWTALGFISLEFLSCAHVPPKRLDGYSTAVGDKAADTAISEIGRPYRYKGSSPSGFDCSGLVSYSYATAGMKVPHSTRELRRCTLPVAYRDMRKGDLVFFNQLGKKYSHVGIYVGDNLFVHAPSTGKTVRTNSLLDPYWKKHLLEARRF
jgi:cell wall-associated NlpC family hydrolase